MGTDSAWRRLHNQYKLDMTRGVEDKNICFHCRKDKKKCVKDSDSDDSCQRCLHYKYDCVPADSYGGTVPQPAFKKQPRCTQCRKDHKVCLPYERVQGQACERCSDKGLQCVAASSSSRPDTPSSRTSFPEFPPYSGADGGYYYSNLSQTSLGETSRRGSYSSASYPPLHRQSSSGGSSSSQQFSDSGRGRGDMPFRTYRPLAPAPSDGQSYNTSHNAYSPTTPTTTYSSLASSPVASPHGHAYGPLTPRSDGQPSERIAEIMSISNLLDQPQRPPSRR